jgi:hypothetical protein
MDGGWVHQNWLVGHTSGFDKTDIGLKYEAYRNNQHETLVSVSFDLGIGHSGAPAVRTDAPDTIQPGIFVGKGFGDLPASLSWLRPFATTTALVNEVPLGTVGRALAPNLTGGFDSVVSPAVETCTGVFRSNTALSDQPVRRWTSERGAAQSMGAVGRVRFDSPRGQVTAATANPGFAYVAVAWQVSGEVILPLNHAGGTGPGFRAQLLFFLDDLAPSLFGKPLLSNQPEPSQTAW